MNRPSILMNPRRGVLRSGWRVSLFFLIVFLLREVSLLATVLIMTGGSLEQASVRLARPAEFIVFYLLLITSALVASAICLRAFAGPPLRSIGYQLHHGWVRDYLVGTGLGAGMITAIVCLELIAGAAWITWSDAAPGDRLYGLVVSFIFFHIAAVYEELIARGYPLQTLLCDVHPVWAVIITAAVFGLLHAHNPGATVLGVLNTTLAGVWLAVAYLKSRSLWLCTSLHWSWNWTMNAIYGLNVSGLGGVAGSSLLDTRQTGPGWLTGGSYGPEGGLLTTVVIGIGTFILWRARWIGRAQAGSKCISAHLTVIDDER